MSKLSVLSADLAHALDPVAFARDRLGFHPDPAQQRLLTVRSPQVILNCRRQWGKSTVTAARAVFTAWHEPGSLLLILSPSLRQSNEIFQKMARFSALLGARPQRDGANPISLVLPNDSRIVGLPDSEDTVRGFSSVRFLVIDEAARVPDEVYFSMLPAVSPNGGELWILSTPKGRRGFFYDAWHDLDQEFTRIRVSATECSRIRPDILERHRRMMPHRWFRQEYFCEFLDADASLFPQDMIASALDPNVKPLFLQ